MDSEGMNFSMPVTPSYGGNGGFGGWGDSWAWIIILLLAFNGGWGNGGFGNGGSMGYDFPWIMNNTNSGFDRAAMQTAISGVQSSLGDISTQLCGGFAGVTAAVTGAQNAVAQQLYTNQIADLERSFAAQTASTQGMSALQAQLATCCCENRATAQDLKYTIATEACADRAAVSAGTQAILDKLCQLELDAKNDTISQLRSQINELSRTASQTAQTATILANNEAQTAALEKYLAPTPIPAYMVANPNCCQPACGCGV